MPGSTSRSARGLAPEHRICPAAQPEKRVQAGGAGDLGASARASDKALGEALKKQKDEGTKSTSRQKHLAAWPKEKADLERDIARAHTRVEKLEAIGRLKDAEVRIRDDEQKEDRAAATRKIRAQEVALKRKAFVEEVAALDKVVEDLGKNPNLNQAKKALNRPDIAKTLWDLNKYLEAAKKRIKTEQITVDPDKANLWVYVILNENKEPTKMVIDPGVDVIQISEAFASEQGITLLDTDPRVNVALGNGHAFSATRIKLKAVQVGSFKVNDVECLVFSKGFDAPPQLGASFLDQFTFGLDAGEAKLTLTKVD